MWYIIQHFSYQGIIQIRICTHKRHPIPHPCTSQLVWTTWTLMFAVPKKAIKLFHSLTLTGALWHVFYVIAALHYIMLSLIMTQYNMKWCCKYQNNREGRASVWERSKNAYELLNIRSLKISMLHKNCVFHRVNKIFRVEFQMYPVKFHTKYLAHTLKDVYFIHIWKFKSF